MSHGLLAGTLAALSVLFASVGSIVPADARATLAPIRIVAFGDSLTAGYGLRPAEAFPARLQAALRAKGYEVTVANAGVSGNTTAAGLARVQRAVPRGTDLAIVELGANDILRNVPPATTEGNLDAILTHVGKTSRRVVLAGMIAPPASATRTRVRSTPSSRASRTSMARRSILFSSKALRDDVVSISPTGSIPMRLASRRSSRAFFRQSCANWMRCEVGNRIRSEQHGLNGDRHKSVTVLSRKFEG